MRTMGKRLLICWNNSAAEGFEKKLRAFLVEFLQHEGYEMHFVYSIEDFRREITSLPYDAVIALCELTWGNGKGKDAYVKYTGIDFIKRELRLKRIPLPVLFLSFAPYESIVEMDPSREMIKALLYGNYFIQLPLASERDLSIFEKMSPLDEMQLEANLRFIPSYQLISQIHHDVTEQTLQECKESLALLFEGKRLHGDLERLQSIDTCEGLRAFCTELKVRPELC